MQYVEKKSKQRLPYFLKIMSYDINNSNIFRWGHNLKVLKFYVLIMTIFWEKGGIVFKGGYYIREDII